MRRLACLLGLALALLVSPASAADEPPLVELAASSDAVSTRVEGWFKSGRVPMTRVPSGAPQELPGPADHAGIRVWIALEDASTARVLFAVQRRASQPPRYLVSDVPIEEGLDELGVERLGQIVYLSAMALWEGNVESSTEEVQEWLRRQNPPPAPPPPPLPPRHEQDAALSPLPVHHWNLRVGAEYAATAAGDEGLAQAIGLNVAMLRERAFGPRLHASLLVPHSVSASGVSVDLRGARFGAGGAYERRLSARVWAPAELGFALDVVRFRAERFPDPSFHADRGATDVRPLAYVRAGVRFDVGPIGLGLAAALDVDFVRAHYDVEDNGRRLAVVTPWLVRPGLVAGASW
jgi:hypothetical protein